MFNFDDIGKKIKSLAETTSKIGIAISIIIAAIIFLLGLASILDYGIISFLIFTFIAAIVGSSGALSAWISGFSLYGFGELIDSNCEIKKALYSDNKSYDYEEKPDIYTYLHKNSKSNNLKNKIICPNCGESNHHTSTRCLHCSAQLK